jgi:hypothetical protein
MIPHIAFAHAGYLLKAAAEDNLAFGVSPDLNPSIRPIEPIGACAWVRTQGRRLKAGSAQCIARKCKQGASNAATFTGRIDEERPY